MVVIHKRKVTELIKAYAPKEVVVALKSIKSLKNKVTASIQKKLYANRLKQVLVANQCSRGIIIYPPNIDWDWLKQRPHHLSMEFAKAGYLVFFCSPQNRTDRLWGLRKITKGLYLCGCLDLLYKIPKPILLINQVQHEQIISKFQDSIVIYDYLDDLSVSSEVVDEEKLARHHRLLINADIVATTATALYDEVKQYREDVLMLPNAASLEHFRHLKTDQIPSDLKAIVVQNKPIIGYYGVLAKWFDYDLIIEVAGLRPYYNFILIGPDYDGSMGRKFEGISNIFLLDEKKYEELPYYLFHFNVAIIPFKVNKITNATSPVKLFEYFCGGKPVVTTSLDECKKYEVVLVGQSPGHFASQLDHALELSKDDYYLEKICHVANRNSWNARATELIECMTVLEGKSESFISN